MPNYTEIPNWFRESYAKKFNSLDMDKVAEIAEEDPVVFGYFYLGQKIRKILQMGDLHMEKYSGTKDFFAGSLKEPNNRHEITFLNDSYIASFPPTLTSLGKSASWFFVDEAHRLNCTETDPDTFFDAASSMVAETGGGLCLSSSPQGTLGFFYRAIDPEKQNPNNEYSSL